MLFRTWRQTETTQALTINIQSDGVQVVAVTPPPDLFSDPPPSATPQPTPTETPLPTATFTPTPVPLPPLPDLVQLGPMTHEYQKLNNCGPVSLAVAANFYGLNITQFDAADVVKGGPGDKNVSPDEMVAYLRGLGLEAVYRVNGNAEILQRLTANNIPVIVHQWLARPDDGVLVGHYRVVSGYDRLQNTFTTTDPYLGPGYTIDGAQFEDWWRPFNRGYIPVFRSDQAELVASLLAEDWDSTNNWERALLQAQSEAETLADGYAFFNLGDSRLALDNADEAVTAYDRAFTFTFPEHFLWYQFGPLEAYNRIGDYQRVLALTADIIAHAGDLEEARLQRGAAYLGLGDAAAARTEIEKALQANPRFLPAQQALAALE